MPSEQNTPASAAADNSQKKPKGKRRLWAKRFFYGLAAFIPAVFILFALILKSDFGSDFLDGKVQAVLQQKIGGFAAINIENARLSLDDNYHIALEMRDTPIAPHNKALVLSRLGRLRFGFATMPLLRRKIQPIQLEVDNAALTLHKEDNPQGIFASFPHDDRGRIDFDAAAALAFQEVEKLTAAADKISINTFLFSNISVTIKSPAEEQQFFIRSFRLRRLRDSVDIKAEFVRQGQAVAVNAAAAIDARGQARSFTASVTNMPVRLGADDNAVPYLVNGRPNSGFFRLRALGDFSLSGVAEEPGRKKLSAVLNLRQAYSDISIDARLPTKFGIAADYSQGSSQIVVSAAALGIGGLEIPFSGRFGLVDAAAPAENSADKTDSSQAKSDGYSFTLKAEDAASSPEASPAEALSFDLDIAGRFSPADKKINLDNIALTTEKGVLLGNGSLRFGAQKWPEIIFILHSASMPVDEAKQLWPANIARAARLWVLSHIFGGDLTNFQLELAMPEGFYQKDKVPPLLTEKELRLSAGIENTRADLIGALPPLREAYGQIQLRGTDTSISLSKAVAYVEDGRTLQAANGKMAFTWRPGQPLWADLTLGINGAIGPIGKLLACAPVNAAQKVPFDMQKAKGGLQAVLSLHFPLQKIPGAAMDWKTDIQFHDFTLGEPYRGAMQVADANGRAQINKTSAQIEGEALLNGVPAAVALSYPLQAGAAENAEKKEKIIFHFDDSLRHKLFPALDIFLQGRVDADVGAEQGGRRFVSVDLTKASLQIPWIGWKKGSGIAAKAEMHLPITAAGLKNMDIDDFALTGPNFQITGKVKIRNGAFAAADFDRFALNRGDKAALSIAKRDKAYQVKMSGAVFDMRAFIKNLAENDRFAGSETQKSDAVAFTAALDTAQGFYGETLRNFRAIYNSSAGHENALISAVGKAGGPLQIQAQKQNGLQKIVLTANDAGGFLRFMNYYDKVQGGRLESSLQSGGSGVLTGPMHMRNFAIVNEPKLASLAASAKDKNGGKVSGGYLAIDHASGSLSKGANYLTIAGGIIRGPSVGATFQGIIYDSTGNIAMTGTYMPAYSVNRILADVPVLGAVLGNGRDKGLIGITFKIEGKFKEPKIIINPISAIAPGILRSIFEFKQ